MSAADQKGKGRADSQMDWQMDKWKEIYPCALKVIVFWGRCLKKSLVQKKLSSFQIIAEELEINCCGVMKEEEKKDEEEREIKKEEE